MIGLIVPAASQFQFLTLAVDKMHWRGPSIELRPQLQLKKTRLRLY